MRVVDAALLRELAQGGGARLVEEIAPLLVRENLIAGYAANIWGFCATT